MSARSTEPSRPQGTRHDHLAVSWLTRCLVCFQPFIKNPSLILWALPVSSSADSRKAACFQRQTSFSAFFPTPPAAAAAAAQRVLDSLCDSAVASWRIVMSMQMWTCETPTRSPSWPTCPSSCSTPGTCQWLRKRRRFVLCRCCLDEMIRNEASGQVSEQPNIVPWVFNSGLQQSGAGCTGHIKLNHIET